MFMYKLSRTTKKYLYFFFIFNFLSVEWNVKISENLMNVNSRVNKHIKYMYTHQPIVFSVCKSQTYRNQININVSFVVNRYFN